MSNDANMDEKVKAVQTLLNAFKLERTLYVIICCISVLLLLGMVLYNFTTSSADDVNFGVVAALFAPAGAITYSIGKILKMWNEALRFIHPQDNTAANGK